MDERRKEHRRMADGPMAGQIAAMSTAIEKLHDSNHNAHARIETRIETTLESVMHRGDNLKELRELTQKLTLANLMPADSVVTSGDGRTFPLYGLLKEERVAVLQTRMGAGMSVESHAHEVVELLIVYTGSIVVSVGAENHELGIGESITLEPGELHRVASTHGADLICVTIPAAREYPDDGRNR